METMFYNGLKGSVHDSRRFMENEPYGSRYPYSNGYLPDRSNGYSDARQMPNHRNRHYDADVDDSDSAHSVDSTGKRKSFRRLITRFAEKTSMQGVPYINNAKLLVAKIIWSFLLLCALVALGVHLWFLITQYYSWPIQTNVDLGYSNLQFPDITICNTNPIHKGRFDKLEGVKELKQLINDLNPRNLVPDQFDDNYDPLAPSNPQPPAGGAPDINPLPTVPATNNLPGGTGTNSSNQSPTDNAQETTAQPNTTPPGSAPQSPSPLVTNPPSNQSTPSTGSPPLLSNSTTHSPLPQVRKKRFVDEYTGLNLTSYKENYKPPGDNDDLTDNEFNGEVATSAEIRDLFEELYMDVSKNNRASIGHNISDMLLSCTFNGRVCDNRQFRLHQTSEYGNCWVLNSDKFIVQSSGPSGGMSLILYLEVQEYLKGLTTGYGTRIQIHEPGTFPYPAEEGLFIPSSMETDIGLKMTLVDRIDGNYGECDSGLSFSSEYKKKYTRRACQRLCEMKSVVSQCGCFSDQHEEIAISKDTSLRPCRSTGEKDCEKRVLRQFTLKTAGCVCPNPCHEILYTRAISNRQWPNDDYARVLLQSICSTNKQVCATLRNDLGDQRLINNNFLKLNIYYEDLNFQNITEEPEIALAQFLSDVGGAVGLWIGLSVLSFCEILQLIVELFDYFVHRTVKRRRREKRRASRRSNALNEKHSKDGDKYSKTSGEGHKHHGEGHKHHDEDHKHHGEGHKHHDEGHKQHGEHYQSSGDKHKPNSSHDLERDSPRSLPRHYGNDGLRSGKTSPFADRRLNHINDIRGYDSDHIRPGANDARHHGNGYGRGMRYEDDYFRRNYMTGYS